MVGRGDVCGTMGRGEGSPAVLHDQFLARDHMVPTVGVVGPVRSFPRDQRLCLGIMHDT